MKSLNDYHADLHTGEGEHFGDKDGMGGGTSLKSQVSGSVGWRRIVGLWPALEVRSPSKCMELFNYYQDIEIVNKRRNQTFSFN